MVVAPLSRLIRKWHNLSMYFWDQIPTLVASKDKSWVFGYTTMKRKRWHSDQSNTFQAFTRFLMRFWWMQPIIFRETKPWIASRLKLAQNKRWYQFGTTAKVFQSRFIKITDAMCQNWFSGSFWPPQIIMITRRKSREAEMATVPNLRTFSARNSL